MNNAKIVESWEDKEEKKLDYFEKARREDALRQSTELLTAIRGLKEDRNYLVFKRILLDPSIQTVQNRINLTIKDLKRDKDGMIKSQIVQDQGMLMAFRKFADLDELENLYKVESEKLSKIIKDAER